MANGLTLPLAIGHVEAFVSRARPLLRLRPLLANAVDLIEEQLVVMADLAVPVLTHANTLAMVYEDELTMLHQSSGHWLYIPQVQQMMSVGYLDFLQLNQPVEVRYWPIHG